MPFQQWRITGRYGSNTPFPHKLPQSEGKKKMADLTRMTGLQPNSQYSEACHLHCIVPSIACRCLFKLLCLQTVGLMQDFWISNLAEFIEDNVTVLFAKH